MAESLVAHRFRVQRQLRDEGVLRLEVARDVAAEESGVLLTLVGKDAARLEVAVRFRLKAATGPLFRSQEVRLTVASDEGLHIFLPSFDGVSFADWLSEQSPDKASLALDQLAQALTGLAATGVNWGRVDLADLAVDAEGPYLLPSAYALPPVLRSETASPNHRQPSCILADVRGALDQLSSWATDHGLAFEVPDVVMPSSGTSVIGDRVVAILEGMDDAGGSLLVRTSARVDSFVAQMEKSARATGRELFVLWPHLRPRPRRRPADAGPALVVLWGLNSYPAFAEALGRLQAGGWIDGREAMVIVPRTQLDGSADLYIASLRNRGSEAFHELDDLEPASSLVDSRLPSGMAGRLLELLSMAERPLPDRTLREAFTLSSAAVVDVLHELFVAGLVRVSYEACDESPAGTQLLVSPEVRLSLTDERHEEIQALLSSTLERPMGRRGLGYGWLRFGATLATDPARAPALVRQLVRRAQKQGAGLVEYAFYDRLMLAADRALPTLEDRCNAAVCCGEQHRREGDLAEADRVFADALQHLESTPGQPAPRIAPLAAELILRMGQLSLHRARYGVAAEQLSGALERYKDHLPAIQRGRLYLELAWALMRLGRARESTSHCEMTLKILDPERYADEVARAYNQLGIAYLEASDYDQSLLNFQRALVLREQIGEPLAVARTYNNLSLTYRSMGRLGEAESCLRKSLELKTRMGDNLGVAATQLNLGLLAIEQGKFEEANKCATECLHLARQLQHRVIEAEAYGLMGEVAMGEGRYEEARTLLLQDLEICDEAKHETERLATLRRFVSLLLKQDDLDEAARRLEQARETLKAVRSRFETAMLDLLEAELLTRTGALEPAVDAFGSAHRIFGMLRLHDPQLEAAARKGETLLRLGQTQKARQSLAEARDLMTRHEIRRVPESFHRLEDRLSEEDASVQFVSGSDRYLAILADLLAGSEERGRARVERALRAAAAGLASEEVYWVSAEVADATALVRGTITSGKPPAEFELLIESAPDAMRSVLQDETWCGVRSHAGRNEWMAVAADHVLSAAEVSFLRAVAGYVALSPSAPVGVLPERPATSYDGENPFGLIGQSHAMREVLRMVDTVKDNDVTILLLGENGTGKDLVARAIHRAGARRDREMVAVNCASIPPTLLESELFGHEKGAFTSAHEQRAGVFERANGGTIFLDEIGEMPIDMQAKLLRVLQEKSFTRVGGTRTIETDVRVVAATNRNLAKEVEQGRFRMDLYYRLNVITIPIPPLRDRTEDIGLLADHFVHKFADEFGSPVRGITQEAVARLMEYLWPGNVRELENVIKNAMVFAEHDRLRLEDLPAFQAQTLRPHQSVEEAVQAMIAAEDYSEDRPLMPRVELLVAHGVVQAIGNKTRAARMLGITRPTLYNLLRKFEALYGATEPGGRP